MSDVSAIPLYNAQAILNAVMPHLAAASLSAKNIRSFNLGVVDGHSIEFAIGREMDMFDDHPGWQADQDTLVALFGSGTECGEPCLWFEFSQTDSGEIVGFQFHKEFGHVEYDAADLFEIWAERLEKLASNIAGFSIDNKPNDVIDGRHRRH